LHTASATQAPGRGKDRTHEKKSMIVAFFPRRSSESVVFSPVGMLAVKSGAALPTSRRDGSAQSPICR